MTTQLITIPNTAIRVAVHNKACAWRAETFWTKEPATIGWLGDLKPDDVLWDVGANIGLYSLFAASRGIRTIAFEPMIPNLYALWENLRANPELAKLITIAPIALSDTDGFDVLHLSSMDIGSSCHSAGEPTNFRGERKEHWQGRHGIMMARAGSFQVLPPPNAIKIDVDGLEHRVVAGFGALTEWPDLRTWCIETNLSIPGHVAMVEHLQANGFSYDPKQFAAAQRREGPFQGVGEAIFIRVANVEPSYAFREATPAEFEAACATGSGLESIR
jgi:FkbM family methyltransferase